MHKPAIFLALVISSSSLSAFADSHEASGEATFDKACGRCHEATDFAGKAKDELATAAKGIISGEVKHPGRYSKFTEEDAERIAAFLASQE